MSVCVCLCRPTSLFVCLCVLICECLLHVSFLSQAVSVYLCIRLCVFLPVSVCVSCLSLSSWLCVPLSLQTCLSSFLCGVCLCGSVRLFCVFVSVSVLCEGLFTSVSGSPGLRPRGRGRRAPLPEWSPVHARRSVQGSEMLGAG